MNPMLLELIQQLITTQGGAFGLPSGGAGSDGPLGQVFGELRNYMDQEQGAKASRLNVNPLQDIEPFRVNPYRGFLAEKGGEVSEENAMLALPTEFLAPSLGITPAGPLMTSIRNQVANQAFQTLRQGGMAGGLSMIPASVQMDTINNVPSNMPGGAGGKYDLSQAILDPNEAFSIPKLQPFVEPIFGPRMRDLQQPQMFEEGGFVQTLLVDDDELTWEHLNLLEKFEKGGKVNPNLHYIPIQFEDGGAVHLYGVEKAFLGKLIKGIGRGLGKVGKGLWEGVKGAGDFVLSNLGMPNVIDNTYVDRSKFLTGLTGTIGKLAPIAANFIPGIGPLAAAGLSAGLSQLQGMNLGGGNNVPGAAAQAGGAGGFQPQIQGAGINPIQGSLFNRINMGGMQAPIFPQSAPPTGGLFSGQFGQPGPFSLGSLFGGGGMMSVPGFAGGMFNIPRGQYGGRVPSYQEGGLVGMPLIPIQTEMVGKQPEMILHVDGTITPVNATTRHKNMDDDEVTDIVPEGSYIASADKSMKISYKDADKIVMGIKTYPYKEGKQSKPPEEITLASLWKKGDKKDKTPAQLAEMLYRKMPTINMDDFEHGADIFTANTNKENIQSRIPYMGEIVRLNEEQRSNEGATGQVQTFEQGGLPRIAGIPHADLGQVLQLLPQALPAIMSLFGGANRGRQGAAGVSPEVSTGLLGTIPWYQAGVNQNIGAQSGALGQAVEDFSSLGNQLIQNARESAGFQLGANQQVTDFALQGQDALGRSALGSAGLGALGAFMTPTEQERLNLGAARARINNFRPRSATRAAQEAVATPQIDQQALAAMGPQAAPLLAQAESDRMRAANQAAIQRQQTLDQAEQNRIGQLNALDQQEALFNIGQGGREQDLQRAANQQMIGSLQQGVQDLGGIEANRFGIQGAGVQRAADLQSGLLGQIGGIQSQILPITTQFALQNAQLAGMPNILGAQNAFNAFTTLGGLQSQNAMAQQLPPGQGGQAGNFGTQPGDSLGNMIRFLFNRQRPMDALGQLPTLGLPTSVQSQSGAGLANAGIPAGVQGIGGTSVPYLGNNIPPVQSQTQSNPFCRGGVHMVTGQPC